MHRVPSRARGTAARTAKLPDRALRTGRSRHGQCHAGGTVWLPGAHDRPPARVRRELAEANDVDPSEVRAILTGGLSAAPWARGIEGIDAIDPDLTLKGLAILHAEVGGGEALELGLS